MQDPRRASCHTGGRCTSSRSEQSDEQIDPRNPVRRGPSRTHSRDPRYGARFFQDEDRRRSTRAQEMGTENRCPRFAASKCVSLHKRSGPQISWTPPRRDSSDRRHLRETENTAICAAKTLFRPGRRGPPPAFVQDFFATFDIALHAALVDGKLIGPGACSGTMSPSSRARETMGRFSGWLQDLLLMLEEYVSAVVARCGRRSYFRWRR